MENSGQGVILFGYPEVLLNYVEAKAELNDISQADIDITINKLRERVGMSKLQMNNISVDPKWEFPTLSPIINEIRRERRIELAIQGFRQADILRWRAHELFAKKRPLGAKFNQSYYPAMVIGVDVFIDNKGYIDFYQKSLTNGYQFDPNRDYLYPLPIILSS